MNLKFLLPTKLKNPVVNTISGEVVPMIREDTLRWQTENSLTNPMSVGRWRVEGTEECGDCDN